MEFSTENQSEQDVIRQIIQRARGALAASSTLTEKKHRLSTFINE